MKAVSHVVTLAQRDALLRIASSAECDEGLDSETEVMDQDEPAPAVVAPEEGVSDADFYLYLLFLEPLAILSSANECCDQLMLRSGGLGNLTVMDAMDLQLGDGDGQTESIFPICFHEDDDISRRAMEVFSNIMSTETCYICKVDVVMKILRVLGGSTELITSCNPAQNDTTTGMQRKPDLYICNDGERYTLFLLATISTSYENASFRSSSADVDVDCKQDALDVLEILLKLSCDATVRERYSAPCAMAVQAVLGYVRSIEGAERPALAPITNHTIYATSSSSTHATAVSAAPQVDEFPSDVEDAEEESQLSQQLQEAALSEGGTPPARAPASAPAPALSAANEATDMEVTASPTEEAAHSGEIWAYSAQFISASAQDSMTVLLVNKLTALVNCEGLSLYALVQMAGALRMDSQYHGLWRYFVRMLLTRRVLSFFPDVDWTDTSTGDVWSITAVLCDCIDELRGQYALPHTDPARAASLWGHCGARLAFFHLVYRVVVVDGQRLLPGEAQDVADVCTKFQRRTRCSELLTTLEGITRIAHLYARADA